MKLHFDSNQDYQLQAIKSIVDIFEGQPLSQSDFQFSIAEGSLQLTENGVGNNLVLSEEQLLKNIQEVQKRNGIDPVSEKLEGLNFKLPFWFKISTPIGKYNPDWALIFKNEKRIYFVAETKSTTDLSKLRNEERLKIKCGEAHFNEFDGVEYKHVASVIDLH